MQNYFSSSFVSCSRKSPAANISPRDQTRNSDAGFCLHGAHQLHPAVQGLQTIILEFNLKLSSCQQSHFFMGAHRYTPGLCQIVGRAQIRHCWFPLLSPGQVTVQLSEPSAASWGTQGTESLHQTMDVNQRKRGWCWGQENGEVTGATGCRGCSVHRAG